LQDLTRKENGKENQKLSGSTVIDAIYSKNTMPKLLWFEQSGSAFI
jgi:hypothetical protein